MKRTAEEFKQAAIKLGISKWDSHECVMCGYMVGYVFGENHELVEFDHGCNCTGRYVRTPHTWDHVANYYNIQSHQEVIADMDKFWGFEPYS